ncbi:BTAD domain-containing putative transcriptional regulator [Lentzea sp. DG1S-22]|uniref:AfsR/SARP family transcriptional regulator n=1 Tax=Lentzea sp. DG1S-22 TaxID=3108822 RepID=UPI002E79DF0A|nr:BTAD domain-containing putative transcriptional regulator [Lentzea sp. DG1S-22]WVH80525.1 BTAD domain-containing putative transcriptional regulator [Lentzea sp. DG1S-22]
MTHGEELLRYEVLGLLRVVRAGQEVDLGAAKQRAVLAVLLLARGTPVSRGQIIEAVWGDNVPSSAVNLVQTYVAGLRRALEPARARRAPAELLTSVGDGYLMRVDPGALDLDVFERQVLLANRLRAAGDLAGAAVELDDALALFRAEPLGGVSGLFFDVERGRLVERRLAVLEERAELGLAIGQGPELVSQLTAVVAEHPLRERGHGLLMRALVQAGRQAEALAAYREARGVLIEELGVEPGPELRRVHQAVLAGESPEPARAPVRTTPQAAAEPAPVTVPAQLPRAPVSLVGRDAEVAVMDALLRGHDGPVLLVTGPAGVGKTALALHWAHRVRDEFPDGQLYVDVHGYDPDREPLEIGEVLNRFLRALGVPAGDTPVSVDERSALLRTLLADRRMLVMLDNVRGSADLLPLLPGAPSCVVVTSRRRLVGLVAQVEAKLVELDMLDPDAAVAVLGRVAGRSDAEADALRELAELCDGLPLALRIAAARLAVSPKLRVAELVEELQDEHGRLAALGLEDGEGTVRAALDASRRALPALASRLLAIIGLHPGADLTAHVVAAMGEVPLPEAQRSLDALTAANLLSVSEPGRHFAHDLVRVYTKTLAGELSEPERRAATGRMLDYYLHCADIADGLLPINRGSVLVAPEHRPVHVPALAGAADAMAWFDAERANLIAAAELASATGWHVHAWQLPYTLSRYLWLRTERETSLRITQAALQAAIALNDDDARFVMQFNVGIALLQMERYDEALHAQRNALEVARRKEDVHQQARALTTIAGTLQDMGRAEEAETHYREAMEISRVAGSKWAEANAHHHLGLLYLSGRRFDDAMPWLRVALRMYHEVGEQCGEAACHVDISTALLETGDMEGALSSARTALAVACDAVSPYHQALAHDRLAAVFDRLGAAGAAAHWQRALALFTELGAPEADGVRARLARARAVTVG